MLRNLGLRKIIVCINVEKDKILVLYNKQQQIKSDLTVRFTI